MSSFIIAVLLILAVTAIVVAVLLALRCSALQSAFTARVQEEVERWRQAELGEVRRQMESLTRQEAQLALDRWKAEHTDAMRHDAIQRSQAVTTGKVFEQLVPYLPGFRFNPKDARFVGSPVDLVVFDGLHDDRCDRVIFVEVKTGTASLSSRERRVRDAIQSGRVQWEELRIPSE